MNYTFQKARLLKAKLPLSKQKPYDRKHFSVKAENARIFSTLKRK